MCIQVCDEGSDSEDPHCEQEEEDEEEGQEVYGISSVINLSHHKVRCALSMSRVQTDNSVSFHTGS